MNGSLSGRLKKAKTSKCRTVRIRRERGGRVKKRQGKHEIGNFDEAANERGLLGLLPGRLGRAGYICA